jgi:hypothetical protein
MTLCGSGSGFDGRFCDKIARHRRTVRNPRNKSQASRIPIPAISLCPSDVYFLPAVQAFYRGVVNENRAISPEVNEMIAENNWKRIEITPFGPTAMLRTRAASARLNALRHGLAGQVTTTTDEDRMAHEKFSQLSSRTSRPREPWNLNCKLLVI